MKNVMYDGADIMSVIYTFLIQNQLYQSNKQEVLAYNFIPILLCSCLFSPFEKYTIVLLIAILQLRVIK